MKFSKNLLTPISGEKNIGITLWKESLSLNLPTPISREKNIGVTLWKERLLSSDGHQWPPYQQNEQSSLS